MFHRPLLACLAVAALAAEDTVKPITITPPGATPVAEAAAPGLRQQASYLIGLQMAGAIKQNDLDMDEVVRAIKDEMAGTAKHLEREEMMKVFQAYQGEMKAKAGEKGKQALAEKIKKPGVKVTASGLVYEVLKASDKANAKTPSASDKVKVNYRGTFTDGREFDSSEKNGGPVSFRVDQVVKGWTEALQLMKEGDKFHLTLPPELGYGENGAGPIPPNAVLEFDVELVEVEAAAAVPAAPPMPKP